MGGADILSLGHLSCFAGVCTPDLDFVLSERSLLSRRWLKLKLCHVFVVHGVACCAAEGKAPVSVLFRPPFFLTGSHGMMQQAHGYLSVTGRYLRFRCRTADSVDK